MGEARITIGFDVDLRDEPLVNFLNNLKAAYAGDNGEHGYLFKKLSITGQLLDDEGSATFPSTAASAASASL